jgi:sporulation protein YlmC with PRC-barrel domain
MVNGPGAYVMPSDTIAGDAVVNRADEDLGRVEQIMIDPASGRIEHAVLASGGVFGIGARFFRVAWRDLTLDPERKCFVLDLPKESLDRFLSSYEL